MQQTIEPLGKPSTTELEAIEHLLGQPSVPPDAAAEEAARPLPLPLLCLLPPTFLRKSGTASPPAAAVDALMLQAR